MKLLELLKSRYKQAESFTKDNFIEDVERSVFDYEAREMNLKEVIQSTGDAITRRYEFTIPLIFTNTEAMKASMFDRLPDVVFRGRGNQDEHKKEKVIAAYEYIKDKLDLETFAMESAHWFILNGFCTAHIGFKSETYETPATDEMGQPMLNEDGTPVMMTLYSYNDPTVEVGDPMKEVWSPESEFSVNGEKIPFYFKKKLMSKEEVKRIYNVDVDNDAELDLNSEKIGDKDKLDTKRVCVYFYYGEIPEENKKDVKEWESGAKYLVIYTKSKILHQEKIGNYSCKIAKWYGCPNKFFGFGLGKIGRQFQKEKSIRRGQQIRLADVAAFPKYAIKNDGSNQVDIASLNDPRASVIILYETEAPQILQPGNLAEVVTSADAAAEKDAQQAFGLLDISQGSQSASVVKTATGQSIFADAAEKRSRIAKKQFMKFFEQVVIGLLKEAQENWDESKLVTITDDEGQEVDVEISSADLKDIDFDKDIEIDAESVSVNKDLLREQFISLYDKTKDDGLVERRNVIKDMMRMGFQIKNADRYIKKSLLTPGQMLVDPNTNQQFVVDQGGELMPQETMNELSAPSGDETIGSQEGLMNSI